MMIYEKISDNVGRISDGNHTVIVEPGHGRWDEFIAASPSDVISHRAIPSVISPFQARAALLAEGLLNEVELAIEVAGPEVRMAWEYATEWRRDSQTIAALADALGLSSEDVDNLFIEASEIVA